uniref:Uncharacterized protein n=1 Tax=Leptobrachium leishanense TaxID=445787 RepID=A0A8C5M2J2_9ANUR
VQGQQGNIGYFGNLAPETRNITNGMTCTSKSSNKDFIVFLNEIQATVIGYEGCDLLAVFEQLQSDTLPDSGVWLLSLNTYFFQDDSFGVRSTSKRVSLQSCDQMALLVLLVMSFLLVAVVTELSSCTKTTALALM